MILDCVLLLHFLTVYCDIIEFSLFKCDQAYLVEIFM